MIKVNQTYKKIFQIILFWILLFDIIYRLNILIIKQVAHACFYLISSLAETPRDTQSTYTWYCLWLT